MSAGEGNAVRVRVWDPLVQVFHWTLATSFLAAYMLDDFRTVHKTFGYIAFGAVIVRIVWGFVGSGHARFADFVPWPRTFLRYVCDTFAGREARYIGHNPAGGAMVVALLTAVLTLGTTGWMMTTDRFWGVEWVEDVHATVANLAIGLVAFHLGGVLLEELAPPREPRGRHDHRGEAPLTVRRRFRSRPCRRERGADGDRTNGKSARDFTP